MKIRKLIRRMADMLRSAEDMEVLSYMLEKMVEEIV